MNDYVSRMRSLIGQEMLLLVGCGAIIEDDKTGLKINGTELSEYTLVRMVTTEPLTLPSKIYLRLGQE
jgi:hypothetical protein